MTLTCKKCNKAFPESPFANQLMQGDHFYNYICLDCSENKTESFERLPMSWCNIIQLALYHIVRTTNAEGRILGEPELLSAEEVKLGRRMESTEHVLRHRREGLYRWREDICRVIDEWWDRLAPNKARTSSWQNSVSSILSANPDLFISGQLLIKQSGWWALKITRPPVPEGKETDPADVLPSPIRGDVDARQLKTDLLKKLQGIDPKLLSEALFQSKRSIASLQKASRRDEKEAKALESSQKKKTPKRKTEDVKTPITVEPEHPKMMTREQFLLEQCETIQTDNPYLKTSLAVLKRKIILHREQRTRGETVFNLNAFINDYATRGKSYLELGKDGLIDDSDSDSSHFNEDDYPFVKDPMISVKAKILGASSVYDPYPPLKLWDSYGGRNIHLYLERDYDLTCPRLNLLREISKQRHPIDMVLLRPEWLPSLHRFLEFHFWPNINVSESLEYPEFSVLVMHRLQIIGAALMTPEGYISYIAVHPEFRNLGLCRRMLLYLIDRACMRLNVDPTMHVSADNPAMLLYQKLGFKMEHHIVNHYAQFYDAKVETSTPGVYWKEQFSKNAFLLRYLRRPYQLANGFVD